MNLKSLFFLLCLFYSIKSYAAEDAPLTHQDALHILNIEDKKDNESQEEFNTRVNKAYHAQAIIYHPDKNPGVEAAKIFITLEPAKKILTRDPQEINISNNSPDDIIKGTFSIFLAQLIKKNKPTIFYLTNDQMPIDDISLEPDYITEEQAAYLQTTFMQDENALAAEEWISTLLEYLRQEKLLSLFCNLEYEKDENTDTIITKLIESKDSNNLNKLLSVQSINLNTPLKRFIQFPGHSALTANLTPLAFAIITMAPQEITSLLINHSALLGNIDKEILPHILPNLLIHRQHETIKTHLKSGKSSSLALCSVLFFNILVKQLQEEKKELEKQQDTNNEKGVNKNYSLDALLSFKIKNIQEKLDAILLNDQVKQLISDHGTSQEYSELLTLSATPTKSTMLPLNFIATTGFIVKDLFNFKTEYTKKRKEKAEEKERQEKKELETKLMQQQIHINSVDGASSTEAESKETSDKKEKQAQKANQSPIKQLQHFITKYAQDIKKNPRHHALLACTLIPWILHYSCWR